MSKRSKTTRRMAVESLKDVSTCSYCGKSLRDNEWHIDHVVPISKGGADALWNMVKSCASCNMQKSHKFPTVEQWTPTPGTKLADGSLVQSRAQWLTLGHPRAMVLDGFSFFIDRQQIEFATEVLGQDLLSIYLSLRQIGCWIGNVGLQELAWSFSMTRAQGKTWQVGANIHQCRQDLDALAGAGFIKWNSFGRHNERARIRLLFEIKYDGFSEPHENIRSLERAMENPWSEEDRRRYADGPTADEWDTDPMVDLPDNVNAPACDEHRGRGQD